MQQQKRQARLYAIAEAGTVRCWDSFRKIRRVRFVIEKESAVKARTYRTRRRPARVSIDNDSAFLGSSWEEQVTTDVFFGNVVMGTVRT